MDMDEIREFEQTPFGKFLTYFSMALLAIGAPVLMLLIMLGTIGVPH